MLEQDRPKELPVKFPKITKERLDKLIGHYWPERVEVGWQHVQRIETKLSHKEPQLYKFLSRFASNFEDPSNFRLGAVFTWFVLEDEVLPKVSLEVIATYNAEYEEASNRLGGIVREIYDPETPKRIKFERSEEFARGKKTVEFNFPIPYDYCEENPALMTWVASWSNYTDIEKESMKMGAMLIYELKRRQFFADQLKKQFGE